VSAVTSFDHKLEIDDYAHVTIRTPSGVVIFTRQLHVSGQRLRIRSGRFLARRHSFGRPRPARACRISGPGRSETTMAPEGYLKRLAQGRQRVPRSESAAADPPPGDGGAIALVPCHWCSMRTGWRGKRRNEIAA